MKMYLKLNLKRRRIRVICIIAGNEREAWTWARGQLLSKEEWFYPHDVADLMSRENFHVLVVGSVHQMPSTYFERLLNLAKARGKLNRR